MISRRRIYTDEEIAARPSKSHIKRQMEALQALGEELAALPGERLKRIKLPENLYEALKEAQGMGRNEARRRQMQYVGKLMREVEPEPIRTQLAALNGASRAEAARLHRMEALREAFIADEKILSDILLRYPDADLQRLRMLRRNAIKEREAQKPPKFFREIFQEINRLDLAEQQKHAQIENANTPPDEENPA